MTSGGRRRPRPPRSPLVVTLAVLATAVILTGTAVLVTIGARNDGGRPSAEQTTGPVEPTEAALAEDETASPKARKTPRSDAGAVRPRGQVSPMPASDPARLLVPAIGVDVDLMDLGLADDGTLEVPPGAFPAGWYDGSPTPGELGPAIVAGHVRWDETPGVFERLAELTVGDEIDVLRDDGSTAEFRVTRTEQFAKTDFPTSTVYGDIDHAGLRLITCGGLDDGTYEDNVVVFAELSGTS